MSSSLTVHHHNYNSTKQEFLVLKWEITEQFQEYLFWKPLAVKTNNNLLTYIMTTPNFRSYSRLLGTNCSQDSPLALSTKRDGTMQLQMPWAKLHQSWTWKLWSPSWTESLWDQQEEQIFMTQWWWKLMNRYTSSPGSCHPRLEQLIHVWTYPWLIGWLLNWKVQYLRLWSIGSPIGKYRIWSISWEMMQILWQVWLSFESGKCWCSIKEPSITIIHCLVSWKKFCSLYSPWLIEWPTMNRGPMMLDTRVSSKCCTYCRTSSGAWHGHTDAESNQQLWMIHPTWSTCDNAPM